MISKRKSPFPNDGASEPINSRPTRPVGRPPLELPDLFPETPEEIAGVVLNTKPKKRGKWRFEKQRKRKSDK